ncbi:unnamed protein product [Paramecium pentaurelia]|uniref:non-specific serine/threonine protein kinase n=1 Tax=Paramecium pentaurelia TaxID=43138 RepID=A0A8S1WN44_9CILI|nr:unnamed protein product [Paramecium pentaurelia]
MEIEKSFAKYAHYTVKQTLGKGAQGKVKLGLDGDKEVALKFVQFSKEIEKEMQIHRGLNHKNLIKLLNFHVNEEYTKRSGKKEIKSCLVYDYMKDGELYEYLSQTGPFKEETARTFFHQLIDVLSYLHGQGLAHRDLKPENILFKDGQLKVSDLGFATFVGGNQGDGVLASFKGTISYMAPEILVRQKYVGQSVDIFAAGIILYLMMTAQLPFKQANAKDQLYNLICTNRFDQFWAYKEKSGIPRFSNELKTLINSMLAFDPLQRPTLSEIISTSWYQGATISNEIVVKLLNARKLKIQAQQDKENLQKLLDKQKRQAANQNQQLTVGIGNFKRGEEDITIDLTIKRELKRFKQTDVILPFEPNQIFVKLIENMDKFANKINYVDDKKYRLHYWFLQNNEEFEMAIQLVHGPVEFTVGLDFELIKGNGLEFYQKKQQVEDMLLQIE